MYRTSHGGGIDRYLCVACGKAFPRAGPLKNHLTEAGKHHDGKCRLCPDFEAKSWQENLAHYETKHGGQIQHKCGTCTQFFLTSEQLRLHERQEHEKHMSAEQVCPYCGQTYRKLGEHIKKRHTAPNTKGDLFKCTVAGCTKVYTDKKELSTHNYKCHKNLQCELCGYTGPKQNMKRHILYKHTSQELRPWQCKYEGCGKGFATPKHLREHENVHTGAKPYKCKHCDACFASAGTMGGHIRFVHLKKKRK